MVDFVLRQENKLGTLIRTLLMIPGKHSKVVYTRTEEGKLSLMCHCEWKPNEKQSNQRPHVCPWAVSNKKSKQVLWKCLLSSVQVGFSVLRNILHWISFSWNIHSYFFASTTSKNSSLMIKTLQILLKICCLCLWMFSL